MCDMVPGVCGTQDHASEERYGQASVFQEFEFSTVYAVTPSNTGQHGGIQVFSSSTCHSARASAGRGIPEMVVNASESFPP